MQKRFSIRKTVDKFEQSVADMHRGIDDLVTWTDVSCNNLDRIEIDLCLVILACPSTVRKEVSDIRLPRIFCPNRVSSIA